MKPRPFHHQRPLTAIAAAWGIGVWAGVRFLWRPLLICAGLLAALAMIMLLGRLGKRRVTGYMAAALMLGMLLSGLASHPQLPAEGKYTVTGVAEADIRCREDGSAAGYLEQARIVDETGREIAVNRLYWTYTPDEEQPVLPHEGDEVTFTGKVYHPSGQQNPYGFDFRLYLLARQTALGVSGAADIRVIGHPGRGIRSLTYGFRQMLGEKIGEIFGEDSALPRALLIGQRDELPQRTVQGFSDAGAAHLLAVSGLHVGLLAAVLMLPMRRWLSPRTRLWVLAGFLLGYCALLDFAAPVVRASLLLVMAEARRIIRRMGDPLTTLSAAFLLILVIRPLSLFTASFQLSFCAVLGIVMLWPELERVWGGIRPRFLREGLMVTLSATAGVALPTVQIFHRFSWVGLALNPVLCAAFSLLLPLYAFTLIVGCVCLPAGHLLAAGMNAVTRVLSAGIEAVGALPFVTVRLPSLPWYVLAAILAAGVMCTRFVMCSRKTRIMLSVTAVALSVGIWRGTVCRDVQYIQLSMGQEDAALILDGDETAVIDTGEHGGDVAAYLLSTGRQADHLILTHLHKDHCLGVLRLLEDRVPIGTVYLPEGAETLEIDRESIEILTELRAKGIPIAHVAAGDTIETRRVTMTVTWPRPGSVRPGRDANRYSMCMLVDLDGVKLLTAGDLTGDYEEYAARDADLLKVAHHGSKTATGTEFLSLVSPQGAIISASGHSAALPHPEVKQRLKEQGIPMWITGRYGAVTVTVRQGQAEITTYWRDQEQP
ncbi:MAG: ComEC/Rec2 family competence protein [Clostridia bacterium]|nr:ComEC/Rec2 family competence protein [Clostridia bacterium]